MRLTLKRLRLIFHNELRFFKSDGAKVSGKVISYVPAEDNKELVIEVSVYDYSTEELVKVNLNDIVRLSIIRTDEE